MTEPFTAAQLAEVERIAREVAEEAVRAAFGQVRDHLVAEEAARG